MGKLLPGPAHISCAVCLNQGRRTQAITVINGYAVCNDHSDLVGQPEFSIFMLRNQERRPL